MNSSRPYLVRALYEWIVDNDMTPYMLVDAFAEGVQVPEVFIEEGKIVLNISPSATDDLILGNQFIEFSARFSGVETAVMVPILAVQAVYAQENGQGMLFAEDGEGGEPTPPDDQSPDTGKKPALKLVK